MPVHKNPSRNARQDTALIRVDLTVEATAEGPIQHGPPTRYGQPPPAFKLLLNLLPYLPF